FRSVYGQARRWAGCDAGPPGADEEDETPVHGSAVRHARSQGSAPWRRGAPDIQPCQLRKAGEDSGTCPGSLEFHRGLQSDRRDVEDHPQPLVVRTTGTKAVGFVTFMCAAYLNVSPIDATATPRRYYRVPRVRKRRAADAPLRSRAPCTECVWSTALPTPK